MVSFRDFVKELEKKPLSEVVEEAKEIIRKYVEKYPRVPFIVLWSGGKDSTALALIAHETEEELGVFFQYLYLRVPGNTHPLVDEYVKNIAKKYGLDLTIAYAPRNFWELLWEKGFPYPVGARWCLQVYKGRVVQEVTSLKAILMTGVKRADSPSRMRTVKEYQWIKDFQRFAIAPIMNWTDKHVMEYLREKGVDLNPCYKMYGASGNCFWCFFYKASAQEKVLSRCPYILGELWALVENPPISQVGAKKGKIKGSAKVYEKIAKIVRKFKKPNVRIDDAKGEWEWLKEFRGEKIKGIIVEKI